MATFEGELLSTCRHPVSACNLAPDSGNVIGSHVVEDVVVSIRFGEPRRGLALRAAEAEPPEGRLGWTEGANQPYSIDTMNDFDPFINDIYAYCEDQGIRIDTLSQEAGPAQFEINFLHGNAVDLADQVFLFKRTVREAAIEHEMHATFLAKPMSEDAGSALHIHQSVVDKQGNNIFSTPEGEPSELFYNFLGGLQRYMPDAMLVFAPYVNSYRRFLNPWDSPVNLAWAIDKRTVGLRVPDAAPDARRIENRIAGSDVNPYLVIAATLACGYLGMVEGLKASDPITGSPSRACCSSATHMSTRWTTTASHRC